MKCFHCEKEINIKHFFTRNFENKNGGAQYEMNFCSKSCVIENMIQDEELARNGLKCKKCDSEITGTYYQDKDINIYCSKECFKESNIVSNLKRHCKFCGDSINNKISVKIDKDYNVYCNGDCLDYYYKLEQKD
jgi:hypothetical protein